MNASWASPLARRACAEGTVIGAAAVPAGSIPAAPGAEPIIGRASEVGWRYDNIPAEPIYLKAADASESRQCLDLNLPTYRCGQQAALALTSCSPLPLISLQDSPWREEWGVATGTVGASLKSRA